MKELKKTIIFLLLFAGSLFLLDRTAGFVLDYFFKKTRTGQSGGNINTYLYDRPAVKLLMLGDSRCLNQVNPDSFKIASFNLAHAGMDDVFQEALIHLLADKKRLPQTLLLCIDQTTFNDEDAKPGKSLYLKAFYNQSEQLKKDIDTADKHEKTKFLLSSYRYNNIAFNVINNSRKKCPQNYNGFEAISVTDFDSARVTSTAAVFTKDSLHQRFTQKSERLQRIIQLCKKEKIKLIVFVPPVFFKKKNEKIEPSLKVLSKLLKQEQITFLNYTRLEENFPAFKNPGIWTDTYHLNEKGAAHFSKIIAADVDLLTAAPISRP